MFARGATLLLAALVAGCAPDPAADAPAASIAPSSLPADGGGKALAAACQGRSGWSDPAPPARIFANVYQVGTCGISVILVTSDAGHILIDGATDQAPSAILTNIERLGFRPRDVRILLNGHEHLDHAGGFAALKRATGARLLVRAPARAALVEGRDQPDDPQVGMNSTFPPVEVDGIVADGEVVALGPLRLTAHATPGHTPGSTSWSWQSCDAAVCRNLVYADSLTAISNDSYRFSDHPAYLAAFRAGLDRIAALPCDLLITPHPQASDLFARLAGAAPLVDPGGCRAYAGAARTRLEARLAREAGQ